MEENSIHLEEKEEITIKIINNEIDNIGDITPNMEFNIMVIGDEGKIYYI